MHRQWKQGQVTWEEYKDAARLSKGQVEWELANSAKNKKRFYRYSNQKRKV